MKESSKNIKELRETKTPRSALIVILWFRYGHNDNVQTAHFTATVDPTGALYFSPCFEN